MNESVTELFFEPKPGCLYLPRTEKGRRENWSGFGNYGPQLEEFRRPILDFVDPETGQIIKVNTIEDFCETPLLFLKSKRRVRSRRGHGGDFVEAHQRSHDHNTMSAHVFYEYHFLFGKDIIAVAIDENRSFGEFFYEVS